MISARHALILRALARGPAPGHEIQRYCGNRLPKEQIYEYLSRLEQMKLVSHAVTGPPLPGAQWPRKEYWLTELGKRAFDAYEFLDNLTHRGARWGNGRERKPTPSPES